jgi:2'-5' RNA ligase
MQVIFALPDLAPKDTAWIEAVRRRHDPQAALIAAHFTLVFPFDGADEAEVLTHARTVCARASPIAFRLVSAMAVRDSLTPRSHVFLTPDVGTHEISALHDALYQGPLAPFLRGDLPYAPHVTVAAFEGQADAEALARSLGPIDIQGRLTALTLARLGDEVLEDPQHLPLGPS